MKLVWRRLTRWLEPTWARCLLLILVGMLVRSPALQGELIWDDSFLARDNPFIKSPILILEAFRHHLLLESLSAHYRPVQNISYMFDYFFWNTNTYGYHLSNILWHVASGVLLYFLLRQILAPFCKRAPAPGIQETRPQEGRFTDLVAFLLALLWVVHPVHSAAIDYISGRADSLAFFFSCAAWLLFLRARQSSRRWVQAILFLLAAFSLLLGLCSRESALMWTLIFLLHLFAFQKAIPLRMKGAILALCLGVVGIYGGLRQLPEGRSSPSPTNGWSAPVQGVLMLRALGDYGRLMLFPSNLHMERTVVNSEAARSNADWRQAIASDYLTILGLLFAAGLAFGAFRKGRGQGMRALGATWFVLTYLPISNLVELNATVAEHWLYLPSVGFLILLAGCCLDLPLRARSYASAFACVAVLALSARSYVRSTDWVSAEEFYRRTIEVGGGSVRVILNLGHIYSMQGKYARAEVLFRKTLALCPTYLVAKNNLADVLYQQGKTEEAERVYREAAASAPEARKEYPRTWMVALNQAHVCVQKNNPNSALQVLAQATRDYPGVWPLIALESELVRRDCGPADAIPSVEKFARAHWWHLESQVALGKLYWETGDPARAEASFWQASRLDMHDVSALNMITLLHLNQKDFAAAYRTQRRAIARQPDEPRQYLILSDILEKMGRPAEARLALKQVSNLQAISQSQVAAN